MTGGQSVAYWSAVAQIVPVLALAVAIEARVLAGRWRKKKNMKRRARRWIVASVYAVLVATLPAVLYSALRNVAEKESNAFDYWFALIWITACTIMVAYIPAATIANAALIDLFFVLDRRLPWSSVNRNERLRLAYSTKVADIYRDLRWAHIEFLTIYGDFLLRSVPTAIAIDVALERSPGYDRELRRRARAVETYAREALDQFEPRMVKYAGARKELDELVRMLSEAATSKEKLAERDLETIRALLERVS